MYLVAVWHHFKMNRSRDKFIPEPRFSVLELETLMFIMGFFTFQKLLEGTAQKRKTQQTQQRKKRKL